jgi:transposase
MVLSTQTTFQKIWLKKGEYPKIEVSNTKKNKSIYGFLNLKTGCEHAFIKDWQNMHITVEVLKEIRRLYPEQKILLFWDGAGWHRGSKVREFIESDGSIEVVYFSPYSPEENSQEHVWKAGRSNITHNKFIPDIEKAANDFVNCLNENIFEYKLLGFSARS